MPKYFEILFCPMWNVPEGASYLDPLDRDTGRKPDFFDIDVLAHQNDSSGAIGCIESHEDLTRSDADRIFAGMVAKYPGAIQTILP